MGLFDFLKKKPQNDNNQNSNIQSTNAQFDSPVIKGSNSNMQEVSPQFNGVQLLDLKKGEILDLTKYSSNLRSFRASAGWKINQGFGDDYDLDLCAYLVDGNRRIVDTVYYGDKNASGIYLDEDNLTGNDGGDAENIYVTLEEINKKVQEIYFAVVIYRANARRQYFSNVKDAYVRLVDESAGNKEICRFRMTEDGGSNTAVLAAKLKRNGSSWEFEAIGKYSKNSISSLEDELY